MHVLAYVPACVAQSGGAAAEADRRRSAQPDDRDFLGQRVEIRRSESGPAQGESTLDEIVALKAWLKERVEDGSKILFPSQKGGMMTRMQFLRLFRTYAQAAKLPANLQHPHTLRHALCSVMAEQHADVYAIQQRAGHRNISNTMIYTHVSDQQASESCQAALMGAFE